MIGRKLWPNKSKPKLKPVKIPWSKFLIENRISYGIQEIWFWIICKIFGYWYCSGCKKFHGPRVIRFQRVGDLYIPARCSIDDVQRKQYEYEMEAMKNE
jgi:hypothetical protein